MRQAALAILSVLLMATPKLATASQPVEVCRSIIAGADVYKAAFGRGAQVLACEQRTQSPRRISTYVHRVEAVDSGVCVALRERVEIVGGTPRKAARLPFENETFMRMGESRQACESYSWEGFAGVSGVTASDFAAIRAALLKTLSDQQETMSVLRRSGVHSSEETLRSAADRTASSVGTMTIEYVQRTAVSGDSIAGAEIYLRLDTARAIAEVAYDPAKMEPIRILSIRFPM